jgi:N-methylhydantoinase A
MATRNTRPAGDKNWIALDAGGTMTDAVIVDSSGAFLVGKFLTNKESEALSFLGSITDAAKTAGHGLRETLSHSDVIVYAGTIMLNTLLSRTGLKAGLIVTRGFEDYLLMEKAEGGWLSYPYADRLHTVTHIHQEPTIPRNRIIGVQERIDLFGSVVIPLAEAEVEAAARKLIASGAETIAVNDAVLAHESRARTGSRKGDSQSIRQHSNCHLIRYRAHAQRVFTPGQRCRTSLRR